MTTYRNLDSITYEHYIHSESAATASDLCETFAQRGLLAESAAHDRTLVIVYTADDEAARAEVMAVVEAYEDAVYDGGGRFAGNIRRCR